MEAQRQQVQQRQFHAGVPAAVHRLGLLHVGRHQQVDVLAHGALQRRAQPDAGRIGRIVLEQTQIRFDDVAQLQADAPTLRHGALDAEGA
mgnify:CR=1 FL=1